MFATGDLEIFSVRADGSGRQQLTHHRGEGDLGPAISPDGERVAFIRGQFETVGKVIVARRDGSRQRRIFTGAYDVTWSPDGAALAVAHGGVAIFRDDGSQVRRLHLRLDVLHLSWSPDGKLLALSAHAGAQANIYTVRPDGRGLRVVVRAPEGTNAWNPRWSPAGDRIVFREVENCRGAETCSGPSFITVVDADGSRKQRLTTGSMPAWSPDGSQIAYGDDDLMLHILQLGNGSSRAVAAVPGSVQDLDWQTLCTLRGSAGRDRLTGRASSDVVCGLRGDDTILGGRGSDRLFGQDGNDRFRTWDGEFDIVGCGPGRDSAVTDPGDRVGLDCEQVSRRYALAPLAHE
jgi:Tol biopolymer transport system component